jgi:hypothetical protein
MMHVRILRIRPNRITADVLYTINLNCGNGLPPTRRNITVPRIIEYSRVVERLAAHGLVCLYYNSGAFGFPPGTATRSVGWIGLDDSTIRPAALPLTRKVNPPVEPTLARLGTQTWLRRLPGTIWVTPKSHWAYELDFGSHLWMPAALRTAGVPAEQVTGLSERHDGAALEFLPEESPAFEPLLLALLTNLFGSDFQLSFPDWPVVCTVHHHKQLWWTTKDADIHARLDGEVPGPAQAV